MSPTGTMARTLAATGLPSISTVSAHAFGKIARRIDRRLHADFERIRLHQPHDRLARRRVLAGVDQARHDASGKRRANIAVRQLILALFERGASLGKCGGIHGPGGLRLVARTFRDGILAEKVFHSSGLGAVELELRGKTRDIRPVGRRAEGWQGDCRCGRRHRRPSRPSRLPPPRRCGPRLQRRAGNRCATSPFRAARLSAPS